MHENRTTYPKKKAQMYQQLQEAKKIQSTSTCKNGKGQRFTITTIKKKHFKVKLKLLVSKIK